MNKVVVHVDQLANWSLALGNVRNLVKGMEQLKVEVVANAEAVKGFLDDTSLEDMWPLAEQGVQFVACSTAMKSYDLSEEQLEDFINTVPSGVVELVEKQAEDYAYLKP